MNKLSNLNLEEISLVDEGANPAANVVLFKRKEVNTVEKNTETKNDKPTVDAEKDALQKRVAELEKVLAERDAADKAEIEKAAAEKLVAENAKVTELLDRLEKRVEEHIEKAETNELMQVAAKYEILGENADELAKVLKSVKGTDVYNKIISNLDRELAYVEKAGTFKEIGKGGGMGGYDAQTQIQKIASEIQKADPTLTDRQALDKAFQAHPELQF